jgi:hypothetical protein
VTHAGDATAAPLVRTCKSHARRTMAEHPTTSWQAMQDGNVFYRQQRLYTLDGKLPSLGDCVIAGCRNGGPFGASALLACRHKDIHRKPHSAYEGYQEDDCYWTCNAYILKVTNSGVLTFRRGLTAAQRTCQLPGLCAQFFILTTSGNKPKLSALAGHATRDWRS